MMSSSQLKIKKLVKSLSLLGIIATIAFFIHGFQIGIFRSVESLNYFVGRTGRLGILIFIVIQMIQVVIPIIPGGLTLAAGVIIFGPLFGFIYNYIGIVLGSFVNFLLAKRYGKTFVLSIIPQKTYDKYMCWIDRGDRFDRFFTLSILFPLAPDDFLCLLAGLTKMTLKKFMVIIFLCKPASLFIFSMGLSNGIEWMFRLFS